MIGYLALICDNKANPRNKHVVNKHAVNKHVVNEHAVNKHAVNKHAVNKHGIWWCMYIDLFQVSDCLHEACVCTMA